MSRPTVIIPTWAAPTNVVAYTTCRTGGVSLSPFDSFNIAQHVGDEPSLVDINRGALPHAEKLNWLEQTHTNRCVLLPVKEANADAAISRTAEAFCAVMTADCVPILVCNRAGTEVAAIHAGWQGLVNGVVENTLAAMQSSASELIAWIGPAISQRHYQVDETLAQRFNTYPQHIKKDQALGKYLLDLAGIAETVLLGHKVAGVFQSGLCTYAEPTRFYSHRYAQHQQERSTGRQVSVIGLLA